RLPVGPAGLAGADAAEPRRTDAPGGGAPSLAARGAHAHHGQRFRHPPGPAARHPAAALGTLPALVLARRSRGRARERRRREQRTDEAPPVMLRDVLEEVDTLSVRGALDREIAGLVLDSRRVQPGDAFFALAGVESDGARFVPAALAAGAAAVV